MRGEQACLIGISHLKIVNSTWSQVAIHDSDVVTTEIETERLTLQTAVRLFNTLQPHGGQPTAVQLFSWDQDPSCHCRGDIG